MRERELRLALVCYGGVSLAIYMHGITKEVWHLVRASRALATGGATGAAPDGSTAGPYAALIAAVGAAGGARLRVIADIVTGASAGGINGVFLAQAIATGQSLEPLTDLWLRNADVDALLDPDARPLGRLTKVWAVPIAWAAMRRRGNAIDRTVGTDAQAEVRAKMSQFVRARWFAPPFGGRTFTHLLFDAFDAMATGPADAPLVPDHHPVDLMVTVTDYAGHPRPIRIHSPAAVTENEHRLTLSFRREGGSGGTGPDTFGDAAALVLAARATASFPGAFPPFRMAELDAVLAERDRDWPGRDGFVAAQFPGGSDAVTLIDGSVLANAPFAQAVGALRQRPARREVDRRFVFIDPVPDSRAISLAPARGANGDGTAGDATAAATPGFFTTILGALSEIPREQPIRDNIEAINQLSDRIARMQRIMAMLQPEVDEEVTRTFGRTFFLDSPTPARLAAWRAKAHAAAMDRAGFAFAAYGAVKLEGVLDEVAATLARQAALADPTAPSRGEVRSALATALAADGLDRDAVSHGGASASGAVAFFRAHDIGFRIRRLRLLARRLDSVVEAVADPGDAALSAMHGAIFGALGDYLERQSDAYFTHHPLPVVAGDPVRAGRAALAALAHARGLMALDASVDARLAQGLAALPRDQRRVMLLSYLGFPFSDIATLPLLQGDGAGEYDPVRIDRIAPVDARAIRTGGAADFLKGVEFNRFGAFFSRAYRENDYLWGRLHGADRLVDIVASAHGQSPAALPTDRIKQALFEAILDEEADRLTAIPDLIAELRREVAALARGSG